MKVRKEWIGSNKPATQGNLADLQEDIHADLQNFATKEDLKNTESKLLRIIKTVLKVVQDIDKHFKEHKDIPGRVHVLENDVFKLKLRR